MGTGPNYENYEWVRAELLKQIATFFEFYNAGRGRVFAVISG